MNEYLKRALELESEITYDRRYIHEHAEVGMDLPNTVAYVINRLKSLGLKPKEFGGGVTATIGKGGKTFLLRADMDALPQSEVSGVDFACKSGTACHSCGHDTHTAMLLAAAKILKENEDKLKGTVKLMFQPGEEVIQGARTMLEAGILENPHVDAAMAIHIGFGPGYITEAGSDIPIYRNSKTAFITNGTSTTSADGFRVTVHGKSAHGSNPSAGHSALTSAVHMVNALNELIQNEVSAAERASMSVCKFHSGTAANIIPDKAVFEGSIRTSNEKVRKLLLRRFKEICEGLAAIYQTDVDVEFPDGVGVVYTTPELFRIASDVVSDICPEVHYPAAPGGAEDFSYISANVNEALFMGLCVGSEAEGYKYPGHDPHMTINESALPYGAACYAAVAAAWLEKRA